MTPPRLAVTIPTYNESENVRALVEEILALGEDVVVVVVDDDSPDGTWRLVEEMAAGDARVRLVRRTSDRGRGLAGREGFLHALASGAPYILEMDADFSHQPRFLPRLVERAEAGADVVLGSRAVPGGRDLGRPLWRRLLTRAANLYIRVVLGVPVGDANSGFRCFRRGALERIDPSGIRARGPGIVQEVLFKAVRAGLRVEEVPIEFIERSRGRSTLNLRILAGSYFHVLRLRWLALTGKL